MESSRRRGRIPVRKRPYRGIRGLIAAEKVRILEAEERRRAEIEEEEQRLALQEQKLALQREEQAQEAERVIAELVGQAAPDAEDDSVPLSQGGKWTTIRRDNTGGYHTPKMAGR